MIPALVGGLSLVGLAATAWLFRLPAWASARDLSPYEDTSDTIRFGPDTAGLVD